jgi:HUS1 checkpoint protein
MKFRARLEKDGLMTIHSVTSTLERISSTAAIYLDENKIRIALITESMDMPKCFVELNTSVLFPDYRIESQSNNTILFEISLDHLSRALASGKTAPSSQLKLVKRGLTPCLSFEAKDFEALAVNIVHDIPVKVLRPNDIVYYMPPNVPPPHVALELPRNNKLMKTIIEKMGKLSKHVNLCAYQNGRIVFRVEHSTATIKTFYNGLQPRFEGNLDAERDADNKAAVKVDVRKLSAVMNYGGIILDGATMCE